MVKSSKKFSSKDPLGLKKAGRWFLLPVILVPILIASLVIVAVLLRGKNSVTSGLNPRQVVELFYTSVNTLDTSAITNCIDTDNVTPFNNRIVANTMSGLISYAEDVTHIHPDVGSDTIIYTPSEWFLQGEPALEHGERVLGIHNLEIDIVKENQYKVTYDYYLTGVPVEGKTVRPFVNKCIDICTLEQRAGDWIIVAIEQVSEESITL